MFFFFQTLKMSKSTISDGFGGLIINMISTDLTTFDQWLQFIHLLFKGPVEVLIFGYLISLEIGYFGWFGIAFILCFIPFQCKFYFNIFVLSFHFISFRFIFITFVLCFELNCFICQFTPIPMGIDKRTTNALATLLIV